jgi:hypothetical protein
MRTAFRHGFREAEGSAPLAALFLEYCPLQGRRLAAGLSALSGKFLSSFFCMNENVVRVSQALFHGNTDFSEFAPIIMLQ